MASARLITIPMSHYCEKARWVLDATGLEYREEPHAPIAHRRATKAVGGKSVPVLVHGDRVLADSSDISRYADGLAPPERRLIPAEADASARVLALEEELGKTLGVDSRLLAYWYTLGDAASGRGLVAKMFGVRSPLVQGAILTVFRALIFRSYRVDARTAERAETRIRATFARLSETLATDPYLVAGRFTLADLTFAALATPLFAVPEHPIMGRSKATPGPALAAMRAELSDTAAGRHVLRMYREHR